MGKNKKQRNEGSARVRQRAPRRGNGWPLALFGLLVLAVGSYSFWGRGSSSGSSNRPLVVPGGERRPTLDPALFTGVVQRGYQIAREIPQVLDQLYCWCKCVEDHGHKSNLSCFAESHAAG